MVQPGQQVCAIVSLEDVWVTAQFKETQLRSIRAVEPVEIRVGKADPGEANVR